MLARIEQPRLPHRPQGDVPRHAEHLVFVFVMMPDEVPLELTELDHLTVELTGDAGLPCFWDLGELLGDIDLFHEHSLNLIIPRFRFAGQGRRQSSGSGWWAEPLKTKSMPRIAAGGAMSARMLDMFLLRLEARVACLVRIRVRASHPSKGAKLGAAEVWVLSGAKRKPPTFAGGLIAEASGQKPVANFRTTAPLPPSPSRPGDSTACRLLGRLR